MRVLYVEDVASDADLTLREMRASAPDIHLEVVGSVAGALAMLNDFQAAMARGESARFDLVLLDLGLPDGSGLAVLAEIRQRSLPLAVVVLTGSGDEQSVHAALRAGADDYVAKREEYWSVLAPTLRVALTRSRSRAARRARPLRLLYAEPNEHDVSLTRIHLATQAPFIRLEVVHTAADVLARLPQSGPAADVDVVLLDYRLPGMDALEALKEILEVRGLDVPVILTTGHGNEIVALEALKLGAADYIAKSPGYLHHLPAAVEAAFHRAEAARENTALVRREQDLHESEERFRQLAENIKEAFWLTDPGKNEMLYISPAYEEIWGRTRKSLYSSPRDWVDAIHPDDRARVVAAAQTLQAQGAYFEQYRILRPDGSTRWIQDRAFPVRDDSGQVVRIAGVAEDITERKQQEQFSTAEKQILELIARNSPIAEVLDSVCRVFEKQSPKGASCSILLLDDDGVHLRHVAAPSLPKRYVRAIDGATIGPSAGSFGTAAHLGRPVIVTDIANDARWHDYREVALRDGLLACWSIPVFSDNGKVVAAFAIYYRYVRAPTEAELRLIERAAFLASIRITREKSERALRDSEAKYRGLIEQASDGIFITDVQGNYRLVNSRACELLGFAESELLGMHGSLTHIEEERATYASRLQSIAEGKFLRYERMMKRKDGSAFPAEVSAKKLGDDAVQVIFRDITERKLAEAELRESEARFRSFVEQSPDAMIIHQTGEIVFANDAMARLMRARSADAILGRPATSLVDAGHTDIAQQRIARLYSGQPVPLSDQVYVRSDGTPVEVEVASSPIVLDGKPAALVTVREITERREQEGKIARQNRIQAVLSGINSAIVRIRDRQELLEEACRIAVEHGGFSSGWIAVLDQATGKLVPVAQAGLPMDIGIGGGEGDRPVGLVPGGTAEVALREKQPAFDNDIEHDPGVANGKIAPDTLIIRRAAIRMGAKSVIVLPLFAEGQTFGILSLYAPERNFFDDEELKLLSELAGDISFGLEFIAKEEKVDYLAYYDALTGLPNRSLFFDRLTHQLGSAAREGLNVALVLMNLDRFRLVNDTLGRQAGDALIITVAQRLKATFRDQDTVARVGADSFAVAVTGTWQAPDAGRVLEAHNRQMFGQPFLVGKEVLRVSATAGVAVFPGDGDHPEVLFANAEAALRKAKQQNARFLFYGPEMNARIADSLRLENRLRLALENGEMVLWYQPKVSVKTGALTGFEALMRWQDPESGMVPPARFIPLMEQTGLILEAGRWAMAQVARDCSLWSTNGIKPPRVAVNVSPLQLRQKDFVDTVVEAVRNTRQAGSMLDLEITESVIMDNVEAIIPILQTARGLGMEIAVDDFGTGYSSLAYIARLPIHALKIDRSFVIGMTQNQESLAIVRSVISLAHSLRLHVVAEGVETEEQATALRQLDCDQMQGYLLSRPVPPDAVPALVRKLT